MIVKRIFVHEICEILIKYNFDKDKLKNVLTEARLETLLDMPTNLSLRFIAYNINTLFDIFRDVLYKRYGLYQIKLLDKKTFIRNILSNNIHDGVFNLYKAYEYNRVYFNKLYQKEDYIRVLIKDNIKIDYITLTQEEIESICNNIYEKEELRNKIIALYE